MYKVFSKVLVIALMLVAFTGQAVAFNTAMPCETLVDSLSPNISEPVNYNDSNLLNNNSSKDCCGIECCNMDCTCIANACSSFVYFNTDVDATKTATLTDVAYIPQPKQPIYIGTLLYRPPIFIL
ncbi:MULTISPECIES: hypothetical protein [unclassified Colwellia]|uniref:hypothetical protein n=1 Tax=unclassified Colwellia TaxID=196834 RepID=UPI0015F3BA61|nr:MULTISPECIES: hypothetical protein [unclassified Colwellia]MBA6231699.1 hypothetical protein [Colwellia sp. MB02u-7]MBA6235563.1 hypothetical protein [Colwellia sp. MB02u-11]MBA6300287.1 hypothetical protein [Colwellia sp. MB3u-22]MBA6312502.1 hypothetical protein [Colwellia sp. MB3u-64]